MQLRQIKDNLPIRISYHLARLMVLKNWKENIMES